MAGWLPSWLPLGAVLKAASPTKTCTGVLGGVLGGTATALLTGMLVHTEVIPPGLMPRWSLGFYTALGVVVGVCAVIGDLFESVLKRVAGIKVLLRRRIALDFAPAARRARDNPSPAKPIKPANPAKRPNHQTFKPPNLLDSGFGSSVPWSRWLPRPNGLTALRRTALLSCDHHPRPRERGLGGP